MKYGQGPPPAGGWKAKMLDPDYSPAYQDEYQRLWHEAAAERDRLTGQIGTVKTHMNGRCEHLTARAEAAEAEVKTIKDAAQWLIDNRGHRGEEQAWKLLENALTDD